MIKSAYDGFATTFNNFGSRAARKSKTFRMFMRALNARPTFSNADYSKFVEEAFQKNPYVYSAITQTANSAASVPPALYRVSETGDVAGALQQYERKTHTGQREERKLRLTAQRVRDKAAQRHSMRTGAPVAISKAIITKALVQTGELEPIEGHELLDLLLNPNDWYQRSYQQFIQAFVMHLEIGGESFMEPIGPESGMPREVYVIPPENVRVEKGDKQHPIRGFRLIHRGGDMLSYDPDPFETEVFYSRYYNPMNPLRGLSPARAAAMSIDVNNEGRKWNLSLLQNGAALSGIISSKGSMSPQQVDSIKERFNQRIAGSQNAGKILALDDLEGIDFTPISQSAKDMQWGNLNTMTALECAVTWNVPPEILGHDESKTFANYEEARRAFYIEKVLPLMDFMYGEMNSSLVPLFGDNLWLDYDTQAVDALNDDVNELHERVRDDIEAGLIMINEGRARVGLEDVDGGDVILQDVRKVPLNTAVQEQEEDSLSIRERALAAMRDASPEERGLTQKDNGISFFDQHANGTT